MTKSLTKSASDLFSFKKSSPINTGGDNKNSYII